MAKKKIIRWIFWLSALCIALLGICLLSLSVGSSGVSIKNIWATGQEPAIDSVILFNIRLPRIILGFAIGGALSVAGVILQGVFRNPLVEPYSLGISGGASLAVALSIVFGLQNRLGVLSVVFSGIIGAGCVIILVYFLSVKKGLLSMQGLLLTGIMLSFICSSAIMLIMAMSQTEELQGIIFWIMGSLEEPNWLLIKLAFFVSLAGLIVSLPFSHCLNAFSQGEEEARGLGIDTEKAKRLLFILSSVLTGMSVSVCGIIGFVGLVVPHLVRIFVGTDHRALLITSYLAGAGFLILCDTVARIIIAPLELPVGVITGILGGIVFIYVLNRRVNKQG